VTTFSAGQAISAKTPTDKPTAAKTAANRTHKRAMGYSSW
jgi:hypothetical protein